MATSQFGVANSDLQAIQPDILGFGIATFETQLQFAENDVLRKIRAEWWERYRHQVRYKDITKVTTVEMTDTKLTDAQWKKSVVYNAMWKYILPILTKWKEVGDMDSFQIQIDFYRDRFVEEFNQVLKDGVEYDEDGGGTVSDSEKETMHTNRLVR
tara:strand:+ start:4055 stop:4522 length:468 start_codon:yes stop_codon:yes gene_type:complete